MLDSSKLKTKAMDCLAAPQAAQEAIAALLEAPLEEAPLHGSIAAPLANPSLQITGTGC
jgi:hypothetical protein